MVPETPLKRHEFPKKYDTFNTTQGFPFRPIPSNQINMSQTPEEELNDRFAAAAALPDIGRAPLCDRCAPHGRCQGWSQIEDEDWTELTHCLEKEDLTGDTWTRLQQKYHFLELDRLKVKILQTSDD
jgi:hypothetical protein